MSGMRLRVEQFGNEIVRAVRFVSESWKLIGASLGVGVGSFVFFVLLTFPQFSIEMIAAGPSYWDDMLYLLLWLIRESSGWLGVLLLGVYALVTGVLITVVSASIRYNLQSAGSIMSVLPAILFSGCASCGAGVLGVIGAFGYASLFPFSGNLVRVIGILLVIISLGWLGDPRDCKI